MDKVELLKTYWGYSEFKGAQEKVIENIIDGKDVLCVMPTGAGKSVCYQLPALMLGGVTIVISPLISLMIDQVKALVNMGIKAAYINSTLTLKQQSLAIERALNGAYKIIYVAPEKLLTANFINLCRNMDISMIAIDEAHCISQWGQDFRPDYVRIVEFIQKLNNRPVISAFTATATTEVKEDIERILKLQNPYVVTTGFDRPNLSFKVLHPQNKDTQLLSIVKDKPGECGIIYCNTRSGVEDVCDILCENGIKAQPYHAGMPMEERKKNQEDFIYDRCRVVVATNAFGMGIDKSDVTYVVHYNMPQNIESYYQEAGRAGRDGNNAECIIMYSGKDVVTNKFLIEKSLENEDMNEELLQSVVEHKLRQLDRMSYYCNTTECLRGYILKYFGQPHIEYCGNCSNCNGDFEEIDITTEAQKILSCIARTRQHYGIKLITDILRGSKNQKLLDWGLNKQSTYGMLKSYSEADVKRMINFLVIKEYALRTQEKFPIIKLNKKSLAVLNGEEKVIMKVQKGSGVKKQSAKALFGKSDSNYNEDMYNYLRDIRNKVADAERVPAYIIFSNTALQDMCVKKPVTMSEFLGINGVGEHKMERYGKIFTCAIGRYIEYENGFYTKEEIDLTPQQFEEVAKSYSVGSRILHKSFGLGTVVASTENKGEYIVKINFDSVGEKLLKTTFYGMKVVNESVKGL
ncbi:MAG: DNA helicase RecQ [Acutalibacteraceae bacterium]|nr:DNA helicase RecQ [Acutalibacteraceae bacterium]